MAHKSYLAQAKDADYAVLSNTRAGEAATEAALSAGSRRPAATPPRATRALARGMSACGG